MIKTRVLDFELYVDPKDSLRLQKNHVYSPIETGLVRKNLFEGDVFFDVGAHIGYFSIIASRKVGREGVVVAFEPDPDNYGVLIENIKLSAISPVIAFNVAVAEGSGIIKLFLSRRNSGDHRIFNSGENRKEIEVETVSLDQFDPQLTKRIDFLKIDVQGADHRVLRGARKLIERNPRLKILIEYFPEGMYLSGGKTNDYLSELRDFDIFFVDRRKSGLTRADRKTLENLFTREKRNYTNLFARRKKET